MIFDLVRKRKNQKSAVSQDDRYLVEYYGYDNGHFGPLIHGEQCFDSPADAAHGILDLASSTDAATEICVTKMNRGEGTCRDVTEDLQQASYNLWEADNLHFYGFEGLPALFAHFPCVEDIPEYQDYRAELNRADYEYERNN